MRNLIIIACNMSHLSNHLHVYKMIKTVEPMNIYVFATIQCDYLNVLMILHWFSEQKKIKINIRNISKGHNKSILNLPSDLDVFQTGLDAQQNKMVSVNLIIARCLYIYITSGIYVFTIKKKQKKIIRFIFWFLGVYEYE